MTFSQIFTNCPTSTFPKFSFFPDMSFLRPGSSILRRTPQNVPATLVRSYIVNPPPSSGGESRFINTLRKLNSVPKSKTLLVFGCFAHFASAVSAFGVTGLYWYLRFNPDHTVMFNVKGVKVVEGVKVVKGHEDPNK